MTARHFLRHLAVAYSHFHPLAEEAKFSKSLESFERSQAKRELLSHLYSMEKRCHSAMAEQASEDLLKVMKRIRALQRKIEGS